MSEWREAAACLGKVAHATAGKAWGVRNRTARGKNHHAERGQELVVYRCAFCHHWHIGNAQKRLDNRQRRIRPDGQRPAEDFR